jgi:CheY-like chemotaxis protein
VLVIDDDPLVLATTVGMLEDLGYATVEARSGQEALELQHAGRQVDLVITDYAMPGMSGLQLAEELHLARPRLPVLLATGSSDIQGTGDTRIERLAKPFSAYELAEAIDRCLGAVMLRAG